MENHIIQGMLDLINEANNAITTDGESAQDVVVVCQHWFAEQHIPIQLDGDSYVLVSEKQDKRQEQ